MLRAHATATARKETERSAPHEEDGTTRSGQRRNFRSPRSSMAAMPTISSSCRPPMRTIPQSVDPRMAGFLRRAEGRRRRRQEERQGRVLVEAVTGRCRPMANWSRRSTAIGAWSRRTSRRRSRTRPRANGAAAVRRRRAAGDARFRARHHDDPRLPHARPSARQSRPARHRQAARGLQRAVAGDLRLHRGRLRPPDLHRQRAGARIRDHPRRCSTS